MSAADPTRDAIADAIAEVEETGRGVRIDQLDLWVVTDLEVLGFVANGLDADEVVTRPAPGGSIHLIHGARRRLIEAVAAYLAKVVALADAERQLIAAVLRRKDDDALHSLARLATSLHDDWPDDWPERLDAMASNLLEEAEAAG